jgi:septum formation protein
MLKLPKLILASGSPRRAEILNAVGWEFEKHTADVDETEFVGENPEDYVQRLAQNKAVTIAEKYPGAIVLGADTIVVADNKIIGKPKNLAEAEEMLRTLSGKWHEVLTGVALAKVLDGKQKIKVKRQTTRVKFAEINNAEIKFLVEKGEPLDKAGAYAVQAQAALFIEEIEGDYWNVVGLPVNLVYKMLDAFKNKKTG